MGDLNSIPSRCTSAMMDSTYSVLSYTILRRSEGLQVCLILQRPALIGSQNSKPPSRLAVSHSDTGGIMQH